MSVYVDPATHRFGRMIMGHMWADSLDELHGMATRLGLKPAWFQTPPAASWDHYDVSKSVRARAIALGAIETDQFGPIEYLAKLNRDESKLAMVARSRAARARAQGALL